MAQVTSEHFDCPNCGANLNPSLPSGHEVFTVGCEYCGKKIRLKQEPAPARGGTAGPRLSLRVERARPRPLLFVIIGVAVVLPLVAGLLIFSGSRSGGVARRLAGGAAATSYPLRCGGSQQLSLDNETVNHPGTIVEASGRCRVSIENTNLTSGAVAIVAGGHATVSVSNANISGAEGAIAASGHARVTVSNSSVTSRKTAVLARGLSEVSLTNSRLSGDEAAYATRGKGKVTTEGTTVSGPVPADAPQP